MSSNDPEPSDRLVIDDDGEATLVLRGEIDPLTAPLLSEQVDRLVTTTSGDVIVDFAGVGFVDSSGLRVIADAQRILGSQDRTLVVRAASPALKTLLDVTGLADHVRTE